MPRRPANPGVKFLIDMEDMNQILGTVYATEKLGTGSRYLLSNIRTSFNHANDEFNRQITASAAASGKYAHMFEWGTAGINTAPTNRRIKSTSEEARLWKTVMMQIGKSNNISFVYKPSKVNVPKPTVKKTGIPRSITNKLSDHVFWNKAKVMETGETVTVTRINSPKLFIPLVYKGPQYKGKYMMVNGPTNPTPGKSEFFRSHANTFTPRFKAFWEGIGSEMMQQETERLFNADLTAAVAEVRSRTRTRWTPPNHTDSMGRIMRRKKAVIRQLEAAARLREAESNGD